MTIYYFSYFFSRDFTPEVDQGGALQFAHVRLVPSVILFIFSPRQTNKIERKPFFNDYLCINTVFYFSDINVISFIHVYKRISIYYYIFVRYGEKYIVYGAIFL